MGSLIAFFRHFCLLFPIWKDFSSLRMPSSKMGQRFGSLWERVQGKPHLRKICEKEFKERQNEWGLLELNQLESATLQVYNKLNKYFPGSHKEPPTKSTIKATLERLAREQAGEGIESEEFYQLILEWASKDLRLFVLNKFLLAFLAAPAMAEITKATAHNVPAVNKIPTPVFISAYTIALVLVQDFRVPVS